MHVSAEEEWSAIEVERGDADSRLVRCLGNPPIKFINPRPQGGTCQVYISNYGGGLVDGDVIKMRVGCGESSRLYLGTQSSTKIYKGNGGAGCVQETVGMLHANALAVVCPDPVVPFADSRYRQAQAWEVHPEADLILFDWLQPGRTARGEVFAYASLRSELRITRPGGVPILSERFALEPGANDPFRCGHFGEFRSFLSVCLIGPRAARLGAELEPAVLALNRSRSDEPEAESRPGGKAWFGMGEKPGAGWLIRAMGADRRDLQPLHDLIFAALEGPAWLGFNPWHRRW